MTSEPPAPTLGVTHQRPRPGLAWWLSGALLVAAGGVIAAVMVVGTFVSLFRTEAHLWTDGDRVEVSVDADRTYLLWTDLGDTSPACFVEDLERGGLLPLHGMGSVQWNRNDQKAFAWFSSGSGEIAVTCEPAGGWFGDDVLEDEVEVGPRPGVPDWIGGLAGAILVPLLLFLGGITVLVITGVRTWRARHP